MNYFIRKHQTCILIYVILFLSVLFLCKIYFCNKIGSIFESKKYQAIFTIDAKSIKTYNKNIDASAYVYCTLNEGKREYYVYSITPWIGGQQHQLNHKYKFDKINSKIDPFRKSAIKDSKGNVWEIEIKDRDGR